MSLEPSAPSYYCGSLVRVGFGEEFNEVGALWIELVEGERPRVKPIRVRSKKLKTISLKAEDMGELKGILESYDENGYIRVVMELSSRDTFSPAYYTNRILSLDERIVKVVLRREESGMKERPTLGRDMGLVEMYGEYLKLCGIDNPKLLEKFKFYFDRAEEKDEAH